MPTVDISKGGAERSRKSRDAGQHREGSGALGKEGERESASCSEKKLCSEGRRVTRVEHVFGLVGCFFFNIGRDRNVVII